MGQKLLRCLENSYSAASTTGSHEVRRCHVVRAKGCLFDIFYSLQIATLLMGQNILIKTVHHCVQQALKDRLRFQCYYCMYTWLFEMKGHKGHWVDRQHGTSKAGHCNDILAGLPQSTEGIVGASQFDTLHTRCSLAHRCSQVSPLNAPNEVTSLQISPYR